MDAFDMLWIQMMVVLARVSFWHFAPDGTVCANGAQLKTSIIDFGHPVLWVTPEEKYREDGHYWTAVLNRANAPREEWNVCRVIYDAVLAHGYEDRTKINHRWH